MMSTPIDHIRSQLQILAYRENIKILLAVESGSRAWGFPSADSDYDIRFIYARPAESYLSLQITRDVIETPTNYDNILAAMSDMNGWDIRKALQCAFKYNAVINEWLVSPITYQVDPEFVRACQKFIQTYFDPVAYAYHYDRLARNSWTRITAQPDQARLKDYCYALRAALSVVWIEAHQSPPPMDMASLLSLIAPDKALTGNIQHLIKIKQTATEKDMMARNDVMDQFIVNVLSYDRPKAEKPAHAHQMLADANTVFRKFIS